ncbi:MAG: sigma-70 family RNA polymerase sigma factor, partial [Limisphaerales bacterium]
IEERVTILQNKAGLSDHEAEDVVQETVTGVAHRMPQFRYDPAVCSFKGWLMHVTRCRIIDYRRSRQSKLREFEPLEQEQGTDGPGLQIRDVAAERAFAELWEEEWERNIVDTALERVKRVVKPDQYQIFYLHSIKNMQAREIGQLLHCSSAKVYVVSHRVTRLVKKEAKILQSKN